MASNRRKRVIRRPGVGYRRLWAALGAVAVLGVVLLVRYGLGGREAKAGGLFDSSRSAAAAHPAPQNAPAAAGTRPDATPVTVALVDGHRISREELGQQCLLRYGEEVLGSVMNKFLIVQHCRARNIVVTQQEIDEEIQKTAQRFGIPTDQWIALLQSERNISAERYASDVVWPTLALRKLAADQLRVSDDEVAREFESRFGEQIRLRLISVSTREKADHVRALAVAAPKNFAKLAGTYSTDVDSASAGGLIPPVRRYVGDPRLEAIAFNLRDGEISEIIPINNQFLILKCEQHIAPHPPTEAVMKSVREQIESTLADRKLRIAGAELFRTLQKQAHIHNVMNDPIASRQMPGVAATVNGEPITIAQLSAECIARYGREVLQTMIQQVVLSNALAHRQLAVTDAAIDAEIARAAVAADVVNKSGQGDVTRWVAIYTKQLHVSEAIYRSDIVWPTVALKMLVDGKAEVTEEDMQRGFEANYGPRVRCRVIVLDHQRLAQQVWDMARHDPSVENFGNLAEKYSVEPGSKALKGEVPPIQMHGGQPALEQEAFALKAGEISGIIQLADKFVILYCEGHTKPVVVNRGEVADLLRADILEKKVRIEMAKEYERLQATAHVDNFLDPKASHAPTVKPPQSSGGKYPDVK